MSNKFTLTDKSGFAITFLQIGELFVCRSEIGGLADAGPLLKEGVRLVGEGYPLWLSF
jgi:hypothetical protein